MKVLHLGCDLCQERYRIVERYDRWILGIAPNGQWVGVLKAHEKNFPREVQVDIENEVLKRFGVCPIIWEPLHHVPGQPDVIHPLRVRHAWCYIRTYHHDPVNKEIAKVARQVI